jgi:hypothetical protein
LRALSLCTCCRHYPGAATGGPTSLIHPVVTDFPDTTVGSSCASSFSRIARRSLALRPAHSRCHQFVARLPEGFSHIVTSMTAPVASGWSGCRAGLAPAGKRRLCTAHVGSASSSPSDAVVRLRARRCRRSARVNDRSRQLWFARRLRRRSASEGRPVIRPENRRRLLWVGSASSSTSDAVVRLRTRRCRRSARVNDRSRQLWFARRLRRRSASKGRSVIRPESRRRLLWVGSVSSRLSQAATGRPMLREGGRDPFDGWRTSSFRGRAVLHPSEP